MGLFSFFRKNKPQTATSQREFRSRSDDESVAIRGAVRGKPVKNSRSAREDAADPMLPEKKRARRRLIGAVALVLAVVIILPMILDSEPKQAPGNIEIQLPSKDLPATADDKPLTAAASGAAQKEAVDDLAASEPLARESDAAVVPSKPQLLPPSPLQASKSQPVIAIPEPAPEKEVVKPQARKPEAPAAASKKDDDTARALAILEGKPVSAPAKPKAEAAKSGQFVIQVAALATQEKIDELRTKLREAGIATYTQKVATKGGDRTRIRVGPFASREEADKMRARIAKLGLNGTLVPT
ncbi:SPOR domain-containing protein [Herbaspirillum sp. RTI4]|uniref:SPOR domain-containing protein n=1 Tax=Herbaspirillum sp. RTI4 TaxID=3048640 RepID=UPI002AB3DFEB|nr:SPOR domain-containing protein [Herbaspirillum sp. RTI4]MDY7578042.1 SPOR domain-containing protein [Herbaspirillum sp. RTI4]MEA9983172.1 SPOR domain-containing protein [Herbaspirillum sp. RTI4]